MQDNYKSNTSHSREENKQESVNSNDQHHVHVLKDEHSHSLTDDKDIKTHYRKAVHHTRQIAEKLGLDPEKHLENVTNRELREKVSNLVNDLHRNDPDHHPIEKDPILIHTEVIKKIDEKFAEKTGEDSKEYQKEYLNLNGLPHEDLHYLLSNALETMQNHEDDIEEDKQEKLEEKEDIQEKKDDKLENDVLKKEMHAVKFEVKDSAVKEDPNAPLHEVKTITSENKEVKINFSKGLKHGPMTITGEHGHPEMEVNFSKDKLDGVSKYYFSNGQLERTLEFKDGKLNGQMQVFQENGTISMDMYFENGLMHGPSKMYNEHGNLHISSNYKHGKLDGDMVIYAEGKPYLKRTYKNGNEIGQQIDASLLKHVH